MVKKKTIAAILAALAVLSAVIVFNLPSISSWMVRHGEPSEDFVEFFTSFYEDPSRCQVLDENGEVVTEEFYAATVGFYENGDFRSIRDYMWNNGIDEVSREGETL